MADSGFERMDFPPGREIVVDAGYLGSGRHIIYALLEADITGARINLSDLSADKGEKISFTAFIAASLAQALQEIPQVHTFLDWRRRLIQFHDVDIVVMIEPEPGEVAIPHIIRDANHKNVLQISQEIRKVQLRPDSSKQAGSLVKNASRVPRFLRLLFFRILKLNPHWFKKMAGTVVITSVGMFGKGGGWGIGFLPTHNLGITVGGISRKPGLSGGQIEIREFLNLTLSFDHDIIDGAPAARFANIFIQRIESGAVLEKL
jgi:pyruvate/2-oxoglutarate dehydrogenase complex dihydrolipoamide acyltransferase (E2) component